MDLGASLSNDNAACLNSLTAELPINFHNAKKEADRNLLPFGYFPLIYRVIGSNHRDILGKISLKQTLEGLTVSCFVAVNRHSSGQFGLCKQAFYHLPHSTKPPDSPINLHNITIFALPRKFSANIHPPLSENSPTLPMLSNTVVGSRNSYYNYKREIKKLETQKCSK